MTTKVLSRAIGRTVGLEIESFTIPVLVVDVKVSWGKVRLEVQPLGGHGSQWVELSRVCTWKDKEAYDLLSS